MKSLDWVFASVTLVIAVLFLPSLAYPTRTLPVVDENGEYASESLVPSSKILGVTSSRERFSFGNRVIVEQQQPGREARGYQSHEEAKTESPYNYEDTELADSDESGVTEKYFESATIRIPSIPAALRRNFAPLVGTTTPEPTSVLFHSAKPKKSKTRRRKVKRPSKSKTTTPKFIAIDDLGGPENVTPSKTNSTGEKNLALEIGSDDGKYALINQFFEERNDTRAPGIVSYSPSQDFAHDNDGTLGNLQQNDIWLSEGDLLVLKGGFYDSASKDKWKPIDSYERRKPALKIPLDTNNPPPFPVFVNKSGPPVFLGPPPPFGLPYPPPGSNETFDPSRFPPPGLIPLYPNGSVPEFFGPPPPGFGLPGQFPQGGPIGPQGGPGGLYGGVNGGVQPGNPGGLFGAGPPGGYGYGGNNDRFPPPGGRNGSYPPLPQFPFPPPGSGNFSGPPPPFYPFQPPPPGFNQNISGGPGGGPMYPFLPPIVLNPADNETDDPSIFLPPPYDFDYYEDNSTIVPPGPFAPGLVVPPPQDFYTVFNRTSPTLQLTTPVTQFFGHIAKRPQRPNAKKPKFPVTNPPDDSLEANLPLIPVSSPLPLIPISFSKKRKRPGKAKSYTTGLKYGKVEKDSSEEYSGETPTFPESVPLTPRPLLLLSRPIFSTTTTTTTTAAPTTTTTTTQRPVNYVYVRGQLKSQAELVAEQAVEDGFDNQSPTPRPPYDELGYPTRARVTDDSKNPAPPSVSIPVIYQYSQRIPTKEPQKLYFQNTPRYNLNYNPNPPTTYKKKSKNIINPTSYTLNKNQEDDDVPRYYQGPIAPTLTSQQDSGKHQQPQYNSRNNQDRVISQYPINNYRKPEPNYPPTQDDNAQPAPVVVPQRQTPTQHTIYQPPQYSTNNNQNEKQRQSQRQPQSYALSNNNGNAGFRPAFAPPQQQRPRNSGRILFPGVIESRNPNIYNTQSPVIYQRQQPHTQTQQQQPQQALQGYYSPISQYHQPIDPTLSGQFIPSTFFPSQFISGSNYPGTRQTQYFSQPYFQQFQQQQQQQHPQQYSTYIQQQSQLQQQQQQPQVQLQEQEQEQAVPLHSDILVNYREPLPQYNTESETITTRTVTKAGPRLPYGGGDPTSAGSSAASTSVSAGSFYSFQRGGPGGFSYKIRL